jgi:hypothetical protein
MSRLWPHKRWVIGLLAVAFAFFAVASIGCQEQLVGCDDPCGCTLFATYIEVDPGAFFLDVSDECGLIETIGPFATLLEAEEAFELY